MKTKALVLAATLLATPALAQTTTAPTAPVGNQATMTAPATGQWRASKLIGVDVYNQQNEKLGEISELILSSNGQVSGAIIGVGGFLGMGERDVMVPLDRLSFSQNPGSTTGTGSAASNNRQWYPDRAVLNATKDQLKQIPEFKY